MKYSVHNQFMLVLCTATAMTFADSSGSMAKRATYGSRIPAAPSAVRTSPQHRPSSPSTTLKGATGVVNSAAATAACTNFGNIIGTAAMLTVGLVPLGFLAGPLPDHTPLFQKLQCVYYFLSIASLANELLAIMYASVASKKLAEVAVAPALAFSAADLIQHDYELHWLGSQIHFMGGLLGFIGMVLIRAYTLFPPPLNQAAAGLGGAALLGMVSIANAGVAADGDGRGHIFGGNLATLTIRYLWLQVKNVWQKKGLVALAALVLGLASIGSAGYNLCLPVTYQPSRK